MKILVFAADDVLRAYTIYNKIRHTQNVSRKMNFFFFNYSKITK